MHIVIVTGAFQPVPPAPGGAVERLWQELAEEFSARDHVVTFLCRAHSEQGSDEMIHGVHYIRRMLWKRSSSLYLDLIKDLIYSLRMMAHIPIADIVVTNTFWLPILLTNFRRRSSKIIVNVARTPKGQMWWYRNVDRLVAVSNAIRDAIVDQYPPASPIVKIIPNPIDTKIFTPSHNPRNYQGILTILYAGRVHPEKGIHLLLKAFHQLYSTSSNVRLRILGPVEVHQGGGGPEYLAKLKSLAVGYPVEFSPPTFVKHELAKAYQEAHVFCYPSLAEKGESFGLAPLEAMATGLAPVVSNLACFRDFVVHGTNGLVFDHRASDAASLLSLTLKELLDNSLQTAQIGKSAAQQALLFSKERVADQYLKDFEELLSGGLSPDRA
jgi:glycosyltransferase involved in cell wall biosynthesis